jgi:hypothetical protein
VDIIKLVVDICAELVIRYGLYDIYKFKDYNFNLSDNLSVFYICLFDVNSLRMI